MAESSGRHRQSQVLLRRQDRDSLRQDAPHVWNREAQDTIDATLDEIHEQFGYTPPLSDVLFADPYHALTEHVESGTYVGRNSVGDTKCHHLAFRQKGIDWQIWIAEGDKPLPPQARDHVQTGARRAAIQRGFCSLGREPQVDGCHLHLQSPREAAQKIDFVKVHAEPSTEKNSPRK